MSTKSALKSAGISCLKLFGFLIKEAAAQEMKDSKENTSNVKKALQGYAEAEYYDGRTDFYYLFNDEHEN